MVDGLIKINNKDYILSYDINTLCLMKEQGLDVMKMDQIEMDLITVRALFYYGLKRIQREITVEQAGDLMTDYLLAGNDFESLAVILSNALAKGMGIKPAKNNAEGK